MPVRDATPANSASRGSRRGLSPPSTTTVISMGSSCAKPAARGPVRTTRAGLVPPAVELAMRASWGEVKWLDVRPVVVPWLSEIGTVVVYLFRERVADAAPPVGDLVVVEYDDGDDPSSVVRGSGRAERAAVDATRVGSFEAHGVGLGEQVRCRGAGGVPAKVGTGSPGLRVGVDLVVVALSDSLLCLPVAAGVQAMTVTVIRTAAASNVMRMVCMIFTSSVRTVRYGLANCR